VPTTHTRFLPDTATSCRSCAAIVTTGLHDPSAAHHPPPLPDTARWMRQWRVWLDDPTADWQDAA
jgi:hypothetical protein